MDGSHKIMRIEWRCDFWTEHLPQSQIVTLLKRMLHVIIARRERDWVEKERQDGMSTYTYAWRQKRSTREKASKVGEQYFYFILLK